MAVSHFCSWFADIRHQKELSVSCQFEIRRTWQWPVSDLVPPILHSFSTRRHWFLMNMLSTEVSIFVKGFHVNKFRMTNRQWKIDEDFDRYCLKFELKNQILRLDPFSWKNIFFVIRIRFFSFFCFDFQKCQNFRPDKSHPHPSTWSHPFWLMARLVLVLCLPKSQMF